MREFFRIPESVLFALQQIMPYFFPDVKFWKIYFALQKAEGDFFRRENHTRIHGNPSFCPATAMSGAVAPTACASAARARSG